jgi:hypothetical protein
MGLQPFHRRLELLEYEPSDIPSGPGEAGDQPALHRVTHDRNDDGNGESRLLCRARAGRPVGHNRVNLKADKLARQSWQAVEFPLGPAVFNDEVAALLVSQVSKALAQCARLAS